MSTHADCPVQEEELPKLPFRRLKYALNQVVGVAIPLHVTLLNELSDNIERLKGGHRPLELRSEQLKASNTVKLLKQDLFELESLNRQVRKEDQDLFQRTVEDSLKNAIEALTSFMSVHSDVLGPFLDIDNEALRDSPEFPEVVCDLNATSPDDDSQQTPIAQLQIERQTPVKKTADAWTYLKGELLEIHSLIHQFSTLVFGQQESVDTIQSNILQTRENVHEGTAQLKKASLLKAASFPLAGAILGGVILGPIGGIVGLKMFGVMGLAGSVLGYSAGNKLKKKQQVALEGIEMKALTYPDKRGSASTPDLSVCDENEQS